MEILLATTNPGKIAELEEGLRDLPLTLVSLRTLDGAPEIIEDGATFEENALKKARALASFSGLVTLADDSGLEVDALQGAPGIRSARYSGPEADDARNNEKLLRELAGVPPPQRGARFICVLALCSPVRGQTRDWIFRGECRGMVAVSPKGANGFGYDPLFFYPPEGRTFGELEVETKRVFSHRSQALKELRENWNCLFSAGIPGIR